MKTYVPFIFSRVSLVLPIAAVLLLSSCAGQSSSPTSYYVLAYMSDEAAPTFSEPQLSADAVVLEPSINPVFDRRQIVRRVSSTELQYLSGDLWAIGLSDAFQHAIRDAAVEIGAFRAVYLAGRDVQARYRIATVVDAVELVQAGDGAPVAHLELELRLYDRGELLTRSSVAVREELSGQSGPSDFVHRVSELLSRSADELFGDVTGAGSDDGR